MELVKIDFEEISDRVSQVLTDFPEVVGAYLFGSALNFCRPDSDIDIGLFANPHMDERARLLLEGRIALKTEPLGEHFFDLTVVNPENILFAFRILHEGILIYRNSPDTLLDLMERISRKYDEISLRYHLSVEEILGEEYSRGIRLSTYHSEDRVY